MNVERYAPLTDIQIRSEGEGRTVDAYASVFDTPQEIRDRDGHYLEVISPNAFDRTLSQRANKVQVMFNHGKTMYGTPSERYSMPIGRALEIRPDQRGLWTSTEVARTPLGDEILELIRTDAITGMSFSGAFRASDPPKRGQDLPTIVRTEIALTEYGPTPFPAYADAHVVGVRSEFAELIAGRSLDEIAGWIRELPDLDLDELVRALVPADPGTDTDDPPDTGHAVDPPVHQAVAALIERQNMERLCLKRGVRP